MADDQSASTPHPELGPAHGPPEAEGRAGFVVHGRVQGVGFRWWTCQAARELGLAGSVRNLRNGGVEVRARGSAGSIERLADALGRGPRSAVVTRVDRFDPGDVAASGFEIEH